ncbi:MFS transporter [Microbacterium kribbense]|uniref:MFS transporter n=1 Tax=Microbacterium kribbense TaxID=433645 RepID=A0ABP7H1G2_9MICO
MAPPNLNQLRYAPPFGRDHLAHAWIVMRGIAEVGDSIWAVALAWTAVQIATPTLAATVVAAGSIPRVLVLLVGGALADRLNPLKIMLLFNVARTLVLLAVACWWLVNPPSTTVLLLAGLLFGICDAFYEPAAGTISRRMVRGTDLPAYGAAMQTSAQLGGMVGSALGGVIIARTALTGSAFINAFAFALVVIFIALWLRPRFALPRAKPQSVLRDITSGFRHLHDVPSTRTLVIALASLNVAAAPAMGIGIALRSSAEGWGPEALGVFGACAGISATLGAATVMKWRPRREAYAGLWAFISQGAAILAIGLGPFWLTVVAAIVIGGGAGFGSVLLGATFAGTTDPALLGRMSAIIQIGDVSLRPLTITVFGVLASTTALWVPFLVYGVAVTGLIVILLGNRELRGLSLGGKGR